VLSPQQNAPVVAQQNTTTITLQAQRSRHRLCRRAISFFSRDDGRIGSSEDFPESAGHGVDFARRFNFSMTLEANGNILLGKVTKGRSLSWGKIGRTRRSRLPRTAQVTAD